MLSGCCGSYATVRWREAHSGLKDGADSALFCLTLCIGWATAVLFRFNATPFRLLMDDFELLEPRNGYQGSSYRIRPLDPQVESCALSTQATPLTVLTNPTLSICIPTYRGVGHLRETLDSVLAQTYSDFELLIVDDNSQDGTDSLVAGYTDARIRFLQNAQNLGPEGNWNRCLFEARGTYVKLLPQDDIIAPSCVEKQVNVLDADENESYSLVCCARNIINPQGRKIMSRGYPAKTGRVNGREAIRRSLRGGGNLFGEPGGVMFRKSLANRVGGFDASIGYVVDVDYWVRLLVHGDCYYIAENLISYRISSTTWSVAIGKGQSAAYRDFVSRVARVPACGLTKFDIISGKTMAYVNNILRLVIYKILL